MTSDDRQTQQLFVGEGDLPSDLDRPNFGAAFFAYVWAWLYGFRAWALGVTLAFLVTVTLEYAMFGSPRALFAHATLYYLISWGVSWVFVAFGIYFGVNFNRMLWARERRRFDESSGDPEWPIPLERFRRSTRVWTALGFSLLGIGILTHVVALVTDREALAAFVLSMVLAFAPLAIIVLIHRSIRRGEARAI